MDKKELEKPMAVRYRECREMLVNAINSFQLPAFLVEAIMKDIMSEVSASSEIEYRQSLMQYQAQDNDIIVDCSDNKETLNTDK